MVKTMFTFTQDTSGENIVYFMLW